MPSNTHVRNFIHPIQFGIVPKRLSLPYPDEEILSGYELDDSSIRDGYSAWVKADPASILKRHLVNAKSDSPGFREAPDRKHSPTNEEYHVDTEVPNRLTKQKRLNIYSWNPGPRRGKEGAVEKHIAGKWHIITLQEAIAYLDHEHLTNRFLCDSSRTPFTHQGFFCVPPRQRRSTGRERRTSRMGTAGCPRATFRRLPRNGKPFSATMSSHINNRFAKKRGIGKKILVAIRAMMVGGACGFGCWGLQRYRVAPPMRQRWKTHQYH